MRSQWKSLILVASSLMAAVALSALIWWQFPWLSSPTYGLKLAAMPTSIDGQKFFTALVREVAEEYPRVRLNIRDQAADGTDAAGKALLDGSADLAIIRSDDTVAGQGRTVVILRKLTAAFLVDSNSSIEKPRELLTKMIGVLEGAKDDRLINAILDFYGFKRENIIAVPPSDVGRAIGQQRVSAMLILGSVNEGPLKEAIVAIRKATKKEPSLLEMDEGEAFVKRFPLYETTEILKGSLRGVPANPETDIDTVAVTIRLVSRPSFPNRTAGELTRIILGTKATLLATLPGVAQIEAPDTDSIGLLPLHPGTVSYLKGEQKDLYEILNDNVYNVMLLGGLLVSVCGWAFRRVRKTPPDVKKAALARLAEIRRNFRSGEMNTAQIDSELDEIAGILADQMVANKLGPSHYLASQVIIEKMRQRRN